MLIALTVLSSVLSAAPILAPSTGTTYLKQPSLREAVRAIGTTKPFNFQSVALPRRLPASPRPPSYDGSRRLGAIVRGAVLGMAVLGPLGGALEEDGCGCDSPGLGGVMTGMAVGAIAGGLLGGRLAW